ncbi:MAG: leucine--tRNA ligase [Patiriisocius sp.]|uniref:leucine--tRNA ligase n=1 Tax=Patiriisocius sp. TaxID=2822396 RepID=UPI003EF4B00F
MSKYHFNDIEAKWQKFWEENQTFKAENNSDKPKYYVLDMFPYPSGAGLHVGHPLGYIASDIYARYKRHKGFNVLHPQGYDSFGLPAEQYAIQTGQHPADTTKVNIEGGVDKAGNEIAGYRKQLDKIGFSFDWSRELRTSDPEYYKWTQWIFIQLFESWYNNGTDKAEEITTLISIFEKEGNATVNAVCDDNIESFSAEMWNSFSETKQQQILLQYRLTYLAETEVNWCPALGTVLANDEIVNGVSERGGHTVVRKKMTQWSMRISAYAERLLQGLETIDWPESLKETQRNWIGKSVGALVEFKVLPLAPSEGGETLLQTAGTVSERHKEFFTGDKNIIGVLLERAKEMRLKPTRAEAVLWEALRGKKLNVKFRRQHPIDKYIVDFVSIEKRLVIEVDGEIHKYQLDKDAERELLIKEKKGFKVLRFTNDEVLNNLESVITKIKEALDFLKSGKTVKSASVPPSGARGTIPVFTTRPDTIFGVSFMTLAPEHELVSKITTEDQKAAVEAYVEATSKRSERERMADVKTISGVFTGAYAEHPFTREPIPVWIGDYVLAGYGTGAVMAVPCGDQRDYDFATKLGIPIPNVFEGVDISEGAHADKEGTVIANSDFLNGLPYKKALKLAIYELEKIGAGTGKTNYRLRDAVFSRQRYWGEPFPVYYVDGMPQMIAKEHLPIRLPEVEKYLPTEEGEPPLGRADVWAWDTKKCTVVSNQLIDNETVYPLELNTMPGWAGSSWYFFRYMEDAMRDEVFASEAALNYWESVDLYIGGSEHATGHLLYSRFWVKFMKDRGFVKIDEPFKKLINQGMILGESAFAHRIGYNILFWDTVPNPNKKTTMTSGHGASWRLDDAQKEGLSKLQEKYKIIEKYFFSYDLIKHFKKGNDNNQESLKIREDINNLCFEKLETELEKLNLPEGIQFQFHVLLNKYNFYKTHVPIEFVDLKNVLDEDEFKNSQQQYFESTLFTDNDMKFRVSREVEKMSKSKYNVVNPDQICEEYGADALRLYEMFLGPLEQAKPWNTAGLTGVSSFLKKLWKLYHSGENESFEVNDAAPSKEALKTLHKTIKKVEEDIENFSFNTSVSTFMIAVNELTSQKCKAKAILEPLAILISPYAPHIAEELWSKLGHTTSISTAPFPKFDASYLVESSKNYPISFNGKMKFTLELSLDLSKDEIEAVVMANEKTKQYLDGRVPKKVIIVPGKIVNIVG